MWFHNMSNGMDQDSMNKWKEEFQNEREEQFSKVKQLQKETQKRRKIMEIRRQMEAAKEEKRRQEALAERRALHVEATMRFQKGIKNFRANKEKISLDDALKSLNKRVNSGDNTITSTTSDAYSLLLNNSNNSHRNRQQSNVMSRNNLRRSSSFNDLLANSNNTIENKLQQYQQQLYNQQQQINQQNQLQQINQQNQQYQHQQQQQQQNEISYFKNYNHPFSKAIEDTFNKTVMSDNTNNNINTTILISQNQNQNQTPDYVKSNNNTANNFKSVLDENQKTIQNFNKEALNEFKNTIMSEIKSANVKEDYINRPCPIQPIIISNHNINNNVTQNNHPQTLKIEQNVNSNNNNNNNNNIKINLKKDLVTSSTDEVISNDEIGLNEDLSSISSHNLSDMEDSLEFDVLKGNTNLRSKSATVTKSVGINAIVPNNDIKPVNNNNNNNNIEQNNDKNSFMNQVSSIKNHFLTKNATNDLFSNNLLSNKKTYFAPQFYNEPHENTENNENKEASNERAIQRANTSGKIQTKLNIKGILKRSTSENTLHLMTQNSNHVNFGLKMDKIEVKDSLEVATNRAKSNNNIAKELNTASKKKSVRFASKDETNEDNDSQVDQNEENHDIEIIQNPGSIAKGAQNRKPVVKARINLNNNKKTIPITSVTITNDESQNDSKTVDSRPPLPPCVHENSYQIMNQKRKEFVEKNRNKNNEILTSPKVTLIAEQTKPEQTQVKHQNNDAIDTKVQSQVTTKNNFAENVSQVDQVEIKKHDNFSTYNNKYGNTTTEPQSQQQTKHLLARFNNTVPQSNNLNDASANVVDPTLNYQVMIMNNNKKYPPNKNVIKAFTNNTSVVEIQQLPFNNHFPLTNSRRPYSANTPLTSNDNHLMVNPTNPTNIVYQNQIVQQVPRINTKLITFNGTSPTSPQRIFSADSASQNMRYKKYINNPMIQLRIQYPDNIKYAQNQAEEDENVTISMNEFLKAEEMCNTQLTESKVMNFLDHMHNKQPNNTPTKLIPVTLSMEEQNVKNSIQRLNDKLNLLNRKTQTGLRSS